MTTLTRGFLLQSRLAALWAESQNRACQMLAASVHFISFEPTAVGEGKAIVHLGSPLLWWYSNALVDFTAIIVIVIAKALQPSDHLRAKLQRSRDTFTLTLLHNPERIQLWTLTYFYYNTHKHINPDLLVIQCCANVLSHLSLYIACKTGNKYNDLLRYANISGNIVKWGKYSTCAILKSLNVNVWPNRHFSNTAWNPLRPTLL